MAVIARDEFNRTESPIVGWTKINAYGDGTMDADAGRATVNKGASTPPLMQWDASVGTLGARKFTVVPTTFDRMNVYPVLVDTDNYIMVYTTGSSLGCAKCVGGTFTAIASLSGITINQGDTVAVETVLDGQLTRHILINVYVDGAYVDYFLLDREAVLCDGAVGIGFENIAESHFDDAVLEQ